MPSPSTKGCSSSSSSSSSSSNKSFATCLRPGHSPLMLSMCSVREQASGDPRNPMRATSDLSERIATPEYPFVEPLTPDHSDDGHSPYNNSDDSDQLQVAAQSLLERLKLPLLLDRILRTADEFERHSEHLRYALIQRSASERIRIRSFAQELCRNCDDLCDEARHQVISGTDAGCSHGHERLEAGGVRVQHGMEGPPARREPLIEPGRGAENDGCETKPGMSSDTLDSDVLPREDNGFGWPDYQCTNAQNRPPPSVPMAHERDGEPTGASSSTSPRPRTPASDTSDISLSMAGSTLVTVSPQALPSALQRAPSSVCRNKAVAGVKEITSEQDCLQLLEQPLQGFIDDSYEQVRQLSLRENSPGTYKALFDALWSQESEVEAKWSDGSQWASLVEASHGERHKGSIRYALTATAFARWHTSQVRLLDGIDAKTAAKEVSARILGPRPKDDGAEKGWEQRRKSLAAHLSRGRKWSRLVENLGAGILLKNAWRLAKSRGPALETLIRELPKSPDKILVLKLLTDQMSLLLEIGKMDQQRFSDGLREEGFTVHDAAPSPQCPELDAFHERLRNSISADTLVIKGSNFRFSIDSLRRLEGSRWLNDEIILACLHLSDKLAFVRVGFSVPIHQQTGARSAMPRPFERAAKQIAEWHTCEASQSHLVCFFPLLQHESHFSLMEINEREGSIYHYDSMGEGENTDIKAACEKEFPQFQYVEMEALRQKDGHSCGPLVIKHARSRMLGRAVAAGNVDRREAKTLRCEAVSILQSAWASDALVAATEVTGQKRRGAVRKEDCQGAKRQRGAG